MPAAESGMSIKDPSLVRLDSESLESLRQFGVQATAKVGADNGGLISTESAGGSKLDIAKVYTRNLATWHSIQPEDKITVSISVSGSYGGKINDRPYQATPSRLNFISMPNEKQTSKILSEETCGWLINFSCEHFLRECESLLQRDDNITQFMETLKGHESFLEGGAQHLLWLKNSPALQWHASSIEATKSAMISFTAARMSGALNQGATTPIRGACSTYVDATIAFMEQSYELPLTLGDLCNVCHVSARTLQCAFNEIRGVTPMQTLRRIRLDRLRILLTQGEDVATSCSKVGLSPTGRTASLYANQFSEKPNQTSARYRSTTPTSPRTINVLQSLS